MGTWYHVKWSDEGLDADTEEVSSGILSKLQEVDLLMSTYKPESELSRFNQSEPDVWFALSKPTTEVFDIAHEVSQKSGGAFDVTVGKLVNMWGFGPQYKPTQVPSDQDIAKALSEVGFDVLELDTASQKIRKNTPVYVDLSAVAKGYAVDRVALYLESLGIKGYMVEVGGEVRTKGVKPDGSKWRIAVESPVVGERRVQDVLELEDMGMATSGDYRNFYEEGGIRYSHTIDPRTGRPIKHSLASVTVLDPSVGYADAWATAMMVLGEEQGFEVAVKQNMAVLFLVKDGSGFKELATPGFKKLTGMPKE
ncbi:FAD:protein FMN transferase [Hahella sp. CCB-MM4]|uniref:FAD:protein FMN transferase n=1 Tax=Hahella sp. (strain CCB-MM4) TaxID=1926491 RepID=UPI001FEE7FAB|nr:FAD:protein FMN transferase [Hahella sp. CCB-MM4]